MDNTSLKHRAAAGNSAVYKHTHIWETTKSLIIFFCSNSNWQWTNSNIPSCLNFASDIQEMQKSPSQCYFSWLITAKITTICYVQEGHWQNCREVLPVHRQSPHTVPQHEDRSRTTPSRTLNFLAFVGLSQSFHVFEDNFFLSVNIYKCEKSRTAGNAFWSVLTTLYQTASYWSHHAFSG